jgi:hypothetical protein
MKQRKEKQKIAKRKNNDNRGLRSWWVICGHSFIFARVCCCFNSFYFFLIVLGVLEALLLKALRMVKVSFIVLKVRDFVLKVSFVVLKVRDFVPKVSFIVLKVRNFVLHKWHIIISRLDKSEFCRAKGELFFIYSPLIKYYHLGSDA